MLASFATLPDSDEVCMTQIILSIHFNLAVNYVACGFETGEVHYKMSTLAQEVYMYLLCATIYNKQTLAKSEWYFTQWITV